MDFRLDENGVLMFRDPVRVPDVLELKKQILEDGHMSSLSIHPGATMMYQDLKKLFWWPGIKKEIAEFMYACLVCQKSKIEKQKPSGLMQPLFVPEWKWDNISMDFVGALPKIVKGFNSIWVIVDRLMKSAHFVSIKTGMSVVKLAEIYIELVVRLLGIPSSIMSDRDPQTDGQTERTIQSLEDLLRACVLEQDVSWVECLPLIEFTYNNSFHSSI